MLVIITSLVVGVSKVNKLRKELLVMVMIIVTACQKTLRQHKISEKEQQVKISVSDLNPWLKFGSGYNWAWTY